MVFIFEMELIQPFNHLEPAIMSQLCAAYNMIYANQELSYFSLVRLWMDSSLVFAFLCFLW